MAHSITRATVTLTRATHAAGMPVRTLRCDALAIPLIGQPEPKGGRWRRFSVADCVRFAVIARLQAFGISLPAAVEVVNVAVDRHMGGLTGCGVELPPSFLVDRLDGLAVHLAPGSDGLDVYTAPLGTPAGAAEAVLILDIGAIATTTIARLETAGASTAAKDTQRSTGGGRGRGGPPTNSTTSSAGLPAVGTP